MRNPRRLVLSQELIARHRLSTSPPPESALFWKMWNASELIAHGFYSGN